MSYLKYFDTYDHSEDLMVVRSYQDVEPIIENNKRLQNDGTKGEFQGGWGRRIASIPMNVALMWYKEDGVLFTRMPKAEKAAYLRRKLNDPQWKYLRTSPGVF